MFLLSEFVCSRNVRRTGCIRSSCTQSLRMKPNCCEDGKGGENQQYQQLSNQEWRFFLCWSQGFQRRHLQKRLDYQNEDIEVECGCGSHHMNRAPLASEMKNVARRNRNCQYDQRYDPNLMRRQEVL